MGFFTHSFPSRFFIICCCCFGFSISSSPAGVRDRFQTGSSMKDGDTLISAGRMFMLGFFGPLNSASRYVGIWYHNDTGKSVVWVANQGTPISGTAGALTFGDDGNLVIRNGKGQTVWSANATAVSKNSVAVLTDAGNLVMQATDDPRTVLWQSFDHPTDTYLPQMQVHFDLHSGESRIFTSWRSDSNPSPGNYVMGIDPRGSPQIVVWEGRNRRRWRSGYWNGIMFTGIPGVRGGYQGGFRLITEPLGEVYFVYLPYDGSTLVKFRVNPGGVAMQELWMEQRREWIVEAAHPVNECDMYAHCGPFGICNQMEMSQCSCLTGFVPSDGDQWRRGNCSGGCIRRTRLHCEADDFLRMDHVKLPDHVDYVGLEDMKECRKKCLQNCSCMAFAFVSGINCMIWTGALVDVQQFGDGGKTLNIRLAQSELGNHGSKIVFIISVIAAVLMVTGAIFLLFKWKGKQFQDNSYSYRTSEFDSMGDAVPCNEEHHATRTDLVVFKMKDVATATDGFSNKNMLGRGGFGQVYKGTLRGGQEVAIKRLSRKSSQGSGEFKNEITLIAKLQHMNLVRLLGCCIQGEERMLVYEYMPNKSLDFYIFDDDRRPQLDWSKRFNIIEGIARGLLYLHQDSRLRIIHRDLKASNILLDEDMNPKISDFGMARIFGRNQNEASTMRVVGTYGYMAPEYAMEGLFSLKSDVYSFGVLLLEIVTGQRNNGFRSEEYTNILGYAWELWKSERGIELLDPSIAESCTEEEQVLRCIQIGMVCVQDMTNDRPSMQNVMLMLRSEIGALPTPQRPTFTSMRHNMNNDVHNVDSHSINDISVTEVHGR